MKKAELKSEYDRQYRQNRRDKGLCPSCGKNPLKEGGLCEECTAYRRRKWRDRSPEQIERSRKNKRDRKERVLREFKKAGLCTSCGGARNGDDLTCNFCKKKARDRFRLLKDKGLCVRCSKEPSLSGDNRCLKCRDSHVENRTKKKLKAISKLGGVCIKCKWEATRDNIMFFEFHHLDPSIKDGVLATMFGNSGSKLTKKALAELEKCTLFCVICHRMKHHLTNEEWRVWDGNIGREEALRSC